MTASPPVPDAPLLAAARKGNKDALAKLLAAYYPLVWRMCVNLIGREDQARPVVRQTMTQSLAAAASWDHDDAPPRWFRHRALLAAREAAPAKPPRDDVLVNRGPDDPAFAAFVHALRKLDAQPREAFLLTHGEGFDLRQLATAMDCSTEAAAVHLRGATTTLQAFAAADFAGFVGDTTAAYRASEPDAGLALPAARRAVGGGLFAKIAGIVGWVLLLAFAAAAGYFAAWLWPRLVF